MGFTPETMRERPLSSHIMPSVAMNGGSFSLATREPEMAPLSAPVPIAARTPVHIGRCQSVRNTPHITAQKVISVPTDRSMPAVMMTKVLATPSTPLTAVRLQNGEDVLHLREGGRGEAEEHEEHNEARKGEQLMPPLGGEVAGWQGLAGRRADRRGGGFALCGHSLIVHLFKPPSFRVGSPTA